MECPNCKHDNQHSDYKCEKCGYGLQCKPKPPFRGPRYIGDKGETRDQELARTYRCSNCRSCGGTVKRIATTGSGITRLMDWQNNEFIVVSCSFCGIIQMYDPKIIDNVSVGWPAMDLLFGDW